MFESLIRNFSPGKPLKTRVGRSLSRRLRAEALEQRMLFAATPLGALPTDTGEFLLGKVAVTPVLFESNGQVDNQTQNWTVEEIDAVLAKVAEGVGWWSELLDTLGTVHDLEFIIDDTFAKTPFSTPYEPIDRPSTDFTLYAGGFLLDQGQGGATTLEEAVYGFNHAQREKLGTDWSFTIFIVDSSDDADGLFAAGGNFSAAFAYAGGLFVVTPSTRPASTIAHEMGHIFWARDEYPGASTWTDQRGYYDTLNTNAADNPTPGFQQEISIMRGGVPLNDAYSGLVSPEATLAMVGWQDSDGDGIFDVADVPLSMQASGYFDAENGIYQFRGEASAVPLINANSSGNQSDITLNRISEVQYRVDGGDWIAALTPNLQTVSFDLSVPIGAPFSTIEWRVIDVSSGVVSPSIVGKNVGPAVPLTGFTGVTYYDENENGLRDETEMVLPETNVHLTRTDGTPLYFGAFAASEFSNGVLDTASLPYDVAAVSEVFDPQVFVQDSGVLPDVKTFQFYDAFRGRWVERWDANTAFETQLQEDVGSLMVRVYGGQQNSYARIEAFNASGDLIGRVTSEELNAGEQTDLRIERPEGDIRRILVYGYAGSSVLINHVEYGFNPELKTDALGVWQIPYLPSGQYLAEFQSAEVIYSFGGTAQVLNVDHGEFQVHAVAAQRISSPQHNVVSAEDVNEDGSVSAVDALVVINDLNRYSARVLTWDDPTTFMVDVNDDGAVSALDALIVINSLAEIPSGSGEWINSWSGPFDHDLDHEVVPNTELTSETDIENGPTEGVAVLDWAESADSDRGRESVDSPNADRDEEQLYGPLAVWKLQQGWKHRYFAANWLMRNH